MREIWFTGLQMLSAHLIKNLRPGIRPMVSPTGAVSLETLKSLSELVAKHLDPVPHTIYRLFESIIDARKETHRFLLKTNSSNPDLEIQKSKDSHKYWTDGLTQAFNALGTNMALKVQKWLRHS